jgi:hypothetical protein
MVTYSSGKTPEEIGAWWRRSVGMIQGVTDDPIVSVEIDMSRCDRHHHRTAIDVTNLVMTHFIAPDEITSFAMDVNYHKHGISPHGIACYWSYGLNSGDGHTSVANTIVVGTMTLFLLYRYCVNNNIIEENKWNDFESLPFRMISLGDDCYILTTEFFSKAFSKEAFGKLGFAAKVRNCCPRSATFCSSIFLSAGDLGTPIEILTGLPGRVFVKMFFYRVKLTAKNEKRYIRAIALGCLNNFNHIPFMKAFFERLIYLTRFEMPNYKFIYGDKSWRKCNNKFSYSTQIDTMDQLCMRYDLTYSQLEDLEKYLGNIPSHKCVLRHNVLERIIEVDLGWTKYSFGDHVDRTLNANGANISFPRVSLETRKFLRPQMSSDGRYFYK